MACEIGLVHDDSHAHKYLLSFVTKGPEDVRFFRSQKDGVLNVTRQTLLRKLEALFDEMERNRAWGAIEIEYRDGVPNMVRTTKNEKLQTQENNRVEHRDRS